MSEFKLPVINHDCKNINESLGISDERVRELEKGMNEKLNKLHSDHVPINQSFVMDLFTKDCKNIGEVIFMAFQSGVFFEKQNAINNMNEMLNKLSSKEALA